jgi:hypothetical protein
LFTSVARQREIALHIIVPLRLAAFLTASGHEVRRGHAQVVIATSARRRT